MEVGRDKAEAVNRRFLPQKPGFDPESFYVTFDVDKLALAQVFLGVLQISPVSIIPPLLHTRSSIYHPHCIMFISQYFSFPLSVSFHHCSILIHLPPILCNVFLSILQFSPVSIIPPLLNNHSSTTHTV